MAVPTAPVPVAPIGTEASARTFDMTYTAGQGVYEVTIQISTNGSFTTVDIGAPWADTDGAGAASVSPSGRDMYLSLASGVVYWWRAAAVNSDGASAFSTPVSFTLADPYLEYATAILTRLTDGLSVTQLGTLIPEGSEVLALLGIDYRDLIQLTDDNHGDPILRNVEVYGHSWTLDAETGWLVDVVSGDI